MRKNFITFSNLFLLILPKNGKITRVNVGKNIGLLKKEIEMINVAKFDQQFEIPKKSGKVHFVATPLKGALRRVFAITFMLG